jgi:hypothetical protein
MDVVFGILILLPFFLVGIAVVVALLTTKRSSLRITDTAVEYRNYPEPPQTVPLAEVTGFDEPTRVGFLSSLRPATVVLVLADGRRVPIRTAFDPQAGQGVDALNARLERVRRNA